MKALTLWLAAMASPLQTHDHAETTSHASAPAHASAYAEGLYLLHNFEYDRAAAAFRRAQAADPNSVMPFWGEAMTYNHPLWAYQDRDKAAAVLARLGPTRQARRAKARNAREAAWLDAVETLYGDGDKLERDRAYHDRMMALHESDPSDVDARSFAALATLGLAHRGRDTALYIRAAALLEEGFDAHPDHPGVLHYLIHSYDDPAHAPLGLRAARRYAPVAPDAGHAQHMVSHIYLAMGQWQDVEATNVQAMEVVNGQRAAAGRPPTSCGHYNEWLVYALDQQGEDSRAIVDKCRVEAMAELAENKDATVLGAGRSLFNNWATIAVRHGVDTGRWPEAPPSTPQRNLLGWYELTYGRLLASRKNPAAAEAALGELRRQRKLIAAAMPSERPDDHESAGWLDRAVAQGEAIAALARGETEEGIRLLKAAAIAEAALPQPFGPPALAKPSGELLADEYLAMGRKAEAAREYRLVLERMPRRRLAMTGLDRSK